MIYSLIKKKTASRCYPLFDLAPGPLRCERISTRGRICTRLLLQERSLERRTKVDIIQALSRTNSDNKKYLHNNYFSS